MILRARLKLPTFPMFLYSLFLSQCKDFIKVKINSKSNQYSAFKNSDVSYDAVLSKIKDIIINKKKPIAVDGICIKIGDNGKCSLKHSTVISGYKRVCNKNGCKDVFKVHNSWGEEWQKATDDGWVDAQTMLNPKYSNVALGWFE